MACHNDQGLLSVVMPITNQKRLHDQGALASVDVVLSLLNEDGV